MAAVNRKVALAIFGILALAGPLLFGASDRIFQIALTFILGLGMLAAPPCFPKTKGIAHLGNSAFHHRCRRHGIFAGGVVRQRKLAHSFDARLSNRASADA